MENWKYGNMEGHTLRVPKILPFQFSNLPLFK